MPRGYFYRPSLEVRLQRKTDKTLPNGCWVWLGSKNRGGYGGIKVKGSVKRVHRLVWELINGPIPSGMLVCHRCDNPKCVNPKHLFLGTHSDNANDMVRKGRKSPIVPHGEAHGRHKLTLGQVEAIRRVRGWYPQRMLAKEFHVGQAEIMRIQTGQLWRGLHL